jgi:hypothetical protein
MRVLNPLNSQSWFCECGIGEKGNCPAPHPTNELSHPGSRERHYLILSILLVLAAVGVFIAVGR